jgi:transcriptional regulator with XRE-family HTH domain
MSRPLSSDAYKAMIDRLVDARRAAGIRQVELAERLGKPQSFISKVERRERRIDVVEFVIIARAIGADAANLFAQVSEFISPEARL